MISVRINTNTIGDDGNTQTVPIDRAAHAPSSFPRQPDQPYNSAREQSVPALRSKSNEGDVESNEEHVVEENV